MFSASINYVCKSVEEFRQLFAEFKTAIPVILPPIQAGGIATRESKVATIRGPKGPNELAFLAQCEEKGEPRSKVCIGKKVRAFMEAHNLEDKEALCAYYLEHGIPNALGEDGEPETQGEDIPEIDLDTVPV